MRSILIVALVGLPLVSCARLPLPGPRQANAETPGGPAIGPDAPAAARTPAAEGPLAAPSGATCAHAESDTPADLAGLDPGLREAIARAAVRRSAAPAHAGARAPTCGELAAVEELELGELQTLRGIECLPRLNALSVIDVKDGDISPLTKLKLRRLALGTADSHARPGGALSLHDFAPLGALTTLQELRVSGARLTGLEPLASLTQLQKLDLRDNHIEDLKVLSALKKLRELRLSDNPLSELSPLAGLSDLALLVLDGTHVVDASPIADLPALRQVVLCGTPVIEDTRAQIRNRAILDRLRRRHVAVPDFRGCHCC